MLLDISLVRENFASKSSTHNEHAASATVGIRDPAIDPWAGFLLVSCIRCSPRTFVLVQAARGSLPEGMVSFAYPNAQHETGSFTRSNCSA